MAHYINKDALVAEIEKIISDETESIKSFEHNKNASEVQRSNARIGVLTYLRSFLDTIEVKEVDFDGERRKYLTEHFNVYEDGILQSKRSNLPLDTYDVIKIAKHFFELGLKVSNPTITAEQDNEWHESNVKPPFTLTMDGNRYSKPMLCYDKFGNYCIAQYARMQTGYCGWYDGYEEVSITHWKELKALKGE